MANIVVVAAVMEEEMREKSRSIARALGALSSNAFTL